jgi:DNA repair exonuclease SbcCD nuclease subunit
MLHGDVSDSVGLRKINLSKLKGKGIDYLALGHYHSYKEESIDDRGVAVYSGCLEGRGYDETGEKGFVLIDVEDEITHKFIPFSERVISLVKVDVTGLKDAYSIYLRAREICEFSKNDLYRVELVGEVDATLDGLSKDLQKYLLEHARFVDVKDLTKKTLDLEKYAGDTSIIGEFVRNVSDSDFSEGYYNKNLLFC